MKNVLVCLLWACGVGLAMAQTTVVDQFQWPPNGSGDFCAVTSGLGEPETQSHSSAYGGSYAWMAAAGANANQARYVFGTQTPGQYRLWVGSQNAAFMPSGSTMTISTLPAGIPASAYPLNPITYSTTINGKQFQLITDQLYLASGAGQVIEVRIGNGSSSYGVWDAVAIERIADVPIPPEIVSLVIDGGNLTITYDQPLDAGSVPAAGAWTLFVSGIPRAVTGVDIDGSQVLLTCNPVEEGEAVALSYSEATASPNFIQAADDDTPAASFLDEDVTNETEEGGGPDVTGPQFVSATFGGTFIIVLFDEPLDTESVPPIAAWSVEWDGDEQTITGLTVIGSEVRLTVFQSSQWNSGDTVLVSFDGPGVPPLQDLVGNDAESFGDEAVTMGGGVSGPAEVVRFEVESDNGYGGHWFNAAQLGGGFGGGTTVTDGVAAAVRSWQVTQCGNYRLDVQVFWDGHYPGGSVPETGITNVRYQVGRNGYISVGYLDSLQDYHGRPPIEILQSLLAAEKIPVLPLPGENGIFGEPFAFGAWQFRWLEDARPWDAARVRIVIQRLILSEDEHLDWRDTIPRCADLHFDEDGGGGGEGGGGESPELPTIPSPDISFQTPGSGFDGLQEPSLGGNWEKLFGWEMEEFERRPASIAIPPVAIPYWLGGTWAWSLDSWTHETHVFSGTIETCRELLRAGLTLAIAIGSIFHAMGRVSSSVS